MGDVVLYFAAVGGWAYIGKRFMDSVENRRRGIIDALSSTREGSKESMAGGSSSAAEPVGAPRLSG